MSKKSPSQYISPTLRSDHEDDDDEESTSTATGSVGPVAAIDNSAHADSMPGATTATTTVDTDRKKSAKDTKEVSFQFKLYEILQREDFKDIVTWLPHGLSWKIIDSEALTKTVLPKFFRHGMYSSFKRQMSGWGFRRGIKVNEYNEYSHPVSPANVIRCVFFIVTFSTNFAQPMVDCSTIIDFDHHRGQLFMRDKPELLSKMKRRVQKRSNKSKPPAVDIVNSNVSCFSQKNGTVCCSHGSMTHHLSISQCRKQKYLTRSAYQVMRTRRYQ